jgi:eukaryotic-like serine/threonine-protein kinase
VPRPSSTARIARSRTRCYHRRIRTQGADEAWLATVGAGTLDTIQSLPSQTIVPPDAAETAARALELLRQLAGTAPTASLQLQPGPVIGQGGMGVVRTAEQVALGRVVAVKTLRPERRADPAAALDLLREAWVTGTIEHPNVVPIHYLGVEPDGSPVIVLKRIAGVEWSELAHDAAAVEAKFGATDLLAWNLGILMQVLNALRFAHHKGVIHRDLKPSNVMIGDFGEVYLLDWGIAVSMRDDGSGRLPLANHATQLAGTPSYMAPEMLGRGTGPGITEQTDVYLAGAVLYELVIGEPPHRGASAIEVLASVIESKPVVPAHVPVELARIISVAMAEDPAGRFESALAMRLALQRYLEHRGSAELGARAHERTDQLLAAIATRTAPRDEIYRLFGACRFGFHEALAVWRDNAEAQTGLVRATVAMAEYELADNNPDTALTLLADIDPPAELVVRAKDAALAKAKRAEELEVIGEKYDDAVGRRTRTFMVVSLGLLYTVAPIVYVLLHVALTPFRFELFGIAGVVLVLGLIAWARDTLTATSFNKRVAIAALFSFVGQLVAASGAWMMDLGVAGQELASLLSWFMFTTMVAIAIAPPFALATVGYGVAFFVTATWPGSFMWAIAFGNATFTLGGYLSWRPGTFEPTAEERERLELAKRRRDARTTRPRAAAVVAPTPPNTDGSG